MTETRTTDQRPRKFRKGEASNELRADWAEKALHSFITTTEGVPDRRAYSEDVSDLLADLMHFCAREGIDFENALKNGAANFAFERCEEGGHTYEQSHAAYKYAMRRTRCGGIHTGIPSGPIGSEHV